MPLAVEPGLHGPVRVDAAVHVQVVPLETCRDGGRTRPDLVLDELGR
jgi:hypothetical protein